MHGTVDIVPTKSRFDANEPFVFLVMLTDGDSPAGGEAVAGEPLDARDPGDRRAEPAGAGRMPGTHGRQEPPAGVGPADAGRAVGSSGGGQAAAGESPAGVDPADAGSAVGSSGGGQAAAGESPAGVDPAHDPVRPAAAARLLDCSLSVYELRSQPVHTEERRIELSPGERLRWATTFESDAPQWRGFRVVLRVRQAGAEADRAAAAGAGRDGEGEAVAEPAGGAAGAGELGDETAPDSAAAAELLAETAHGAAETAHGVAETARGAAGAGELVAETACDAVGMDGGHRAAPRYGFLSDFAESDSDERDLDWLRACHITHVQFYDWMYRHEALLPPERRYTDALGRVLDVETVRGKIDGCHARGMEALAYGAVYGASAEYARMHPEQRLYRRDGTAHTLVDWLAIMNIAPDSDWSRHIAGEFAAACSELGFDGIHLDTYGYPKRAYDSAGGLVALERCFPALIALVRERIAGRATLFFNAVNNWPVPALAACDLDATYVEVWPPNSRYEDLWRIAREARLLSPRTPVLAAYLEPFDAAAGDHSPDSSSERTGDSADGRDGPAAGERHVRESVASLRYATAVITTAGASHLVLGEDGAVLCHPYYVRHALLPEWARSAIRRYYDFLTAYGALLAGDESVNITLDHAHGPDDEVLFDGCDVSAHPIAGSLWAAVCDTPGYYVVSLVNLSALGSDEWNVPHPEPAVPIEGLRITLVSAEAISVAATDTPDREASGTAPVELALEALDTHKGPAFRVEVPPVWLWRLVWFRKDA